MVVLKDQAGAVRAGEELDMARLQPFLQDRLGSAGPITVEQFPGGHSNLTYRLRLGDRELVLRRPPFRYKLFVMNMVNFVGLSFTPAYRSAPER